MKSSHTIEKLGIPLPPVVGNGMVRPRQGRTHHSAANAVSGRNLQRLVAAASKIQLQNEFIKPEIPIS